MMIEESGWRCISWSLRDVADAIGAAWQGEDIVIKGVSTDTRKLQTGQLYIALRGEHFDGEAFLAQAQAKGAVAAIVHEPQDIGLPQLVVDDTRRALAALARAHRLRCRAQVLALTGSNGKTTTKELLKRLLATQGKVLATQGNLNNDIGVPLTLLRLQGDEDFAVIEMGANHIGEIANLVNIAEPDAVLVTNVAAAHLEGFGSFAGVIKAKSEIYSASKTAKIILNNDLICADDWRDQYACRVERSFALAADADVCARNISDDGRHFTLCYHKSEAQIDWQLLGKHNVSNALAAFAAASLYGATVADAATAWHDLALQQGRLSGYQVLGHVVYDDTYNANVASFKAGIDVLAQSSPSLVVAGAMGELGEQSVALHREVSDYARQQGIDQFWCVGSAAQQFGDADGFIHHFADHAAAASALKIWLQQHDAGGVLVKGSRSAHMENVLNLIGVTYADG